MGTKTAGSSSLNLTFTVFNLGQEMTNQTSRARPRVLNDKDKDHPSKPLQRNKPDALK